MSKKKTEPMNTLKLASDDFTKLLENSFQSTKKTVISIEGSTCCGKTTFAHNIHDALQRVGTATTVIREAATEILEKDPSFHKRLSEYPANSNPWKEAKLELQMRIITTQIKDLTGFFQSNHRIAIMDRSGASTAYHTLPYLNKEEQSLLEPICIEIIRMSKIVIFLPPIGVVEQNSLRYQKSYDEVKNEDIGIRHFLDKWGINYKTLASSDENTRTKEGLEYITSILNESTTSSQ